MAYPGKIIYNPYNAQQIRFLRTGKDTGGRILEMEATYDKPAGEPVPHYHPYQEEFFTVVEGELSVRADGQVRVLTRGEKLHIPPGLIHTIWNGYGGKTIVNWTVMPALNTEYFLETAHGLAADGKVDRKGMPHVLQAALIMNKFGEVFRLAKPPFLVQKMIFIVLVPLALLAGYRATYKCYPD